MGKLDRQYQSAVDAEIRKIALNDLAWISSLDIGSVHNFEINGITYSGCLIHYLPLSELDYSSIVLKLNRKLLFGCREYCAGFSFKENKVLPISYDLLYS